MDDEQTTEDTTQVMGRFKGSVSVYTKKDLCKFKHDEEKLLKEMFTEIKKVLESCDKNIDF